MLYSTIDYESVEIKVGDDVLTKFGRGRVINTVTVRIRKKDSNVDTTIKDDILSDSVDINGSTTTTTNNNNNNTTKEDSKENDTSQSTSSTTPTKKERVLTKYQIQLTSWRLAKRSTVKCYLFPTQVQAVRKKTIHEMTALERVEFASTQKQSATILFSQKQYQQALNLYAGAIDAVRSVQHDDQSSNECRADLVEVMVTCSNNAAVCCSQLKQWVEASRFAMNALILMDALYSKRGLKIHTILCSDKLSDSKIFGEWRAKSRLIIAKGLAVKEEHGKAIEEFKKARECISEYLTSNGGDNGAEITHSNTARLKVQEKEILKLMAKSVEKRKNALKKEKARAMAMFGGSKSNGSTNGNDVDRKRNGIASTDTKEPVAMNGTNGHTHKETKTTKDNKIPTNVADTKSSPTSEKKRVSFSPKLEERRIIQNVDDGDDDEEEPWYEEHKEALMVLAIGGLATMTSMLLMRRK